MERFSKKAFFNFLLKDFKSIIGFEINESINGERILRLNINDKYESENIMYKLQNGESLEERIKNFFGGHYKLEYIKY